MSDVGSARTAMRICAVAVVLLSAAFSHSAGSSARDAGLCEDAAALAARETGVPRDVLMAITLTETGRSLEDGKLKPWPWAVNVAGEGHWFPSRAEAEQFVEATIQSGRSNFDVGCFQLNHRWHAGAFASTREMFDPRANAVYAARYLKDLQARSGDWSMAAGAYHSATPDLAARYRDRFDRLYAGLPETAAPEPGAIRVNGYPLLRAGGVGAVGSLVPLDGAPTPLFGN
ncbi:transglycosylase SLT domain-containing protein [Cereibacter sphaeroides]|uniref:transglycosylase SLT domain-containing protein n=1 Tax=Cereibacter sphaeroides TaxID=1063 RepID=UPI001F2887C9|nr:transglycosylase SLT domain-containing protein [Cereibacter sphaeroides]MCE6952368.1 transglycosylase SLT domain-containing protein [Cereibacter sphaeroides]